MELYSGGEFVDVITSAASPDAQLATGHGFVSPVPIDSIRFTSTERGDVLLGAPWSGRMRTCNGIGSGSLPDTDVEAFDRALARLMQERSPAETIPVRHRVWATVVRRP